MRNAFPDFQNQSQQVRCVDITMETWSVFYTGSKAHLVKRGVGEFDLQPNERKALMLGMGPRNFAKAVAKGLVVQVLDIIV